MKKIIILFMVFILAQAGYSYENITEVDLNASKSVAAQNKETTTLEAAITFDWLDISQAERQDQVNNYRDLLFENNASDIYYTKEKFNKNFSSFKHDKEFKHHYMLTNNGVTSDKDANYCAFYYKKNTLVMYAIQYKNNMHNAFYYTAFGKLYYVDVLSDEYPNYPYTSMQYDRKGRLKSAIYFVSKDFQYMYGPNKEFQGVWYKDKMYDMNGKQKLTRTNW